MTEAYKFLFGQVREIINRHDPVKLMESGAPEDEYDPEIGTILPRLRQASSAEDVCRIVFEEFQRWFGPDAGAKESAYDDLAREIWDAWQASSLRITDKTGRAPCEVWTAVGV